MKPAENLVNILKRYVSIFENNQREMLYIDEIKDFSHILFFASEFGKQKTFENLSILSKETIEDLAIEFAKNYALMVWGKNIENKDELFKRIPSLESLLENDSSKSFEALKTLVNKTVEYCYENAYKAKYFNEYIINYKNQQYYLRGDSQIPPVVAFDLDGTVVNSNIRVQKMQNEKDSIDNNLSKKSKAYRKLSILRGFHSSVESDIPYKHMTDLIAEYKKAGFEIMVLTARPNEYMHLNKEFLNKFNIPIDIYVGRPVNNGMPDTDGKYSWLNENVSKERIRGFFEDRKEIIEYFRRKDKVHIYDVEDYHKKPTEDKMISLVKDCIKRKNNCEDYFLLNKEKENYKYFYKKAEEYYEKRIGIPFSETEKKRLEEKNYKFKPNIS